MEKEPRWVSPTLVVNSKGTVVNECVCRSCSGERCVQYVGLNDPLPKACLKEKLVVMKKKESKAA